MNRAWKSDIKTMVPGLRVVHCEVATTTSGTLAATQLNQGLKLTKTATKTGRYTCQLQGAGGVNADAFRFINVWVTQIGPDDAALTDAKGVWQGDVRDEDIGTGAKDGTIEIQFVDADSRADAEVQDGAVLYVTMFVQDSSVS